MNKNIRRHVISLYAFLFVFVGIAGLMGAMTAPVFAEDTSWQQDYEYRLDQEAGTIVLLKYKGTATSITIPASATIDGVSYSTHLSDGAPVTSGFLIGTDVESLAFESGVKAPANANHLFAGSKVKTVNLTNLDMSAVTTADEMFMDCHYLTTVTAGTKNLSALTSAKEMFRNCNSLTTLNLAGWAIPAGVNTTAMFQDCANLETLSISGFRGNAQTAQTNMFAGCNELRRITLGANWQFRNDTKLDFVWSKDGGTTYYTAQEMASSFPGAGTYVRSLNEGWSVSIKFYDVTNGSGTATDKVTWDASNGGYDQGTQKKIKILITLKNNRTLRAYAPGELTVKIPNLMAGQGTASYDKSTSQLMWSSTVGGNYYSQTTGMPWNYTPPGNYAGISDYVYTNANTINQRASVNQTIEIVYTLIPNRESVANSGPLIEEFEDSCTHTHNRKLTATINNFATSNTIEFDYKRVYEHPWKQMPTKVSKTVRTTPTATYADSDDDYYWVTYSMGASATEGTLIAPYYPHIGYSNIYMEDPLPEGCIVRNVDNGVPYDAATGRLSTYSKVIAVGYPKSLYDEDDTITNTVKAYGTDNRTGQTVCLGEATSQVAVKDLKTERKEIFEASKSGGPAVYNQPLYYDKLRTSNGQTVRWNLNAGAVPFFGNYDLTFTDEGLEYQKEGGDDYVIMPESKYYFTAIRFNSSNIPQRATYPVEIYVRHRGDAEYELYKTTTTQEGTLGSIQIEDTDVVNVRVIIRNLDRVISMPYNNSGSSVLELDAHVEGLTDLKAPTAVYGYLRNKYTFVGNIHDGESKTITGTGTAGYQKYELVQPKVGVRVFDLNYWNNSKPTQDSQSRTFKGWQEIRTRLNSASTMENAQFALDTNQFNVYKPANLVRQIVVYNLLPAGMEVDSMSAQNLTLETSKNARYYTQTGQSLTHAQIQAAMKAGFSYEKTEDYKGTGRTLYKYTIDVSDNPFYLFGDVSATASVNIRYNFTIPFDSVYENGVTYTNEAYVATLGSTNTTYAKYGIDTYDVNGNGSNRDQLVYCSDTLTLQPQFTLERNLDQFAKTDVSGDFVDTDSIVGLGSDYQYKLRVRTGSNGVKNLIIYDRLESAKTGDDYWRGTLKDIDVSHDEAKGYQVKVYTATDETIGSLYDGDQIRDGWELYTIQTNKGTVRALAFEYLTLSGGVATIQPRTEVYPIVTMVAPDSADEGTYAVNQFTASWDEVTGATPTPISSASGKITLQLSDRTAIAGKITWEGDNGKERPAEMTVELLRNGEKYKTQTVQASKNWEYDFSNLPIADIHHQNYEYSVRQTAHERYSTVYKKDNATSEEPKAGHFDVHNTYVPKDFTITYDPAGGTFAGSEEPTVYTYQEDTGKTVAAAAKRDHYRFLGWEDEEGVLRQPEEAYTVTWNKTFTAKWEPIMRQLTFDPAGGTFRDSSDPVVIEWMDGGTLTIPEAPTREGYVFLYWEGSEYYPGDDYPVTEGDHTFTAKWQEEPRNLGDDDDDPVDPTPTGGKAGKVTPVTKPGKAKSPATEDEAWLAGAWMTLLLAGCTAVRMTRRQR